MPAAAGPHATPWRNASPAAPDPNLALWDRLASLPLGALVIETAFRDDDIELATISRHLCPAQLQRELERLPGPTDVCITHIKPGEVDAVMSEIGAQSTRHRITALVSGQVMRCDCTPTRRGHASNVRAKLHAEACQLERG